MGAETNGVAEKVDDLLEAARYNDIDDLRTLASDGLSLHSRDSQGRTALHMAAANGHMTIVEYLISEGVDINALNDENNAPLHWACLNGHVELLTGGKEIDLGWSKSKSFESRTPMDEAIGAEKMEIIDAINTTVAQMELENTSMT
ncbi:putative protein [Arabidopsis thaliana]|uniref:Uncharacterized protein At5g12320 n=1 Tax=Arabidopsis thaliana TaxID=3702 RepID=Q94CL0_ARATH|nr:putative protein [Arabidopsis thaliana]